MSSGTAADYDDNGPKLLAVILVLRIVSFLVVCLRIWSRWALKKLGSDDWCIVVATISSIGLSIASGLGIGYGTGRHIWVLPASVEVSADKLLYIDQVLYPITLGLTKISILLFYSHISPSQSFSRMVNVAQAVTVSMTISLIFAFAFQCTPASFAYDRSGIPGGTCVDKLALNYAAAALNIVTDIWVYAIPIPIFWRLKCPTKKRVVVIIIFSLGGLTCIASIIRLKTLYYLAEATDKTWILYEVTTWSAVETSTGIMTASIPAIKPLIDRFFPKFLDWQEQSGYVGHMSNAPPSLEDFLHVEDANDAKGEDYTGGHTPAENRSPATAKVGESV